MERMILPMTGLGRLRPGSWSTQGNDLDQAGSFLVRFPNSLAFELPRVGTSYLFNGDVMIIML